MILLFKEPGFGGLLGIECLYREAAVFANEDTKIVETGMLRVEVDECEPDILHRKFRKAGYELMNLGDADHFGYVLDHKDAFQP